MKRWRKPAVVITDARREIKPDASASSSKRYIKEYDNAGHTDTIVNFSPTRTVSTYLEIDDDHGAVKICSKKGAPVYLLYSQIMSCEIFVDDVPGSNTGLLGAAAGGLLFGGTGAVVGGIAGKQNLEYINSISVRIRTSSSTMPAVSVETLGYRSKNGTSVVKKAIEDARSIQDMVEYVINAKQKFIKPPTTQAETSNASNLGYIEELRKLKELADEGIITLEEFETKKKQILS